MKDKELSNKIKIKSDCLQESSVEGASEGLVKKASRQSFNGDLNMNKVISVHLSSVCTLECVLEITILFLLCYNAVTP